MSPGGAAGLDHIVEGSATWSAFSEHGELLRVSEKGHNQHCAGKGPPCEEPSRLQRWDAGAGRLPRRQGKNPVLMTKV